MMLNYHLADTNYPANRYRITLELDTHDDFNPHQINYSNIFNLQDDEHINYYIEPLWNINYSTLYNVTLTDT